MIIKVRIVPMINPRYGKKGENRISTVDLVMKKVQVGPHDGPALCQKVIIGSQQ